MAVNDTTFQKCRSCLIEGAVVDMHSLQSKHDINEMSLSELIAICASVQISPDDSLPQFICNACFEMAKISYKFRLQCENSDRQLRSAVIPTEQQVKSSFNCKAEFKKRKDLTDSLTHSHFACMQCGSNFSQAANLRKHMRWHYSSQESKPAPATPAQQRTCDQCGKEFKYRTSMLKHRRKHGATARPCPHCDEIPATAALLARHMEQEHAHFKSVVCNVCDKTFFKQANLRLHMAIHSGIKKHMCEICGISFALAGNLTAHRRLHTGHKPYTCNHCGRGFTQQAALRSHEAGHSTKKDHICSDCGAAFSRPGALRNHRKRHLAVRPFVCNLCGKAFTFSSERKRHMTIHTGEKNHVCDVCGRRFNRSTNLAVHRRIHTGETPHICSICGKGFIQAHCLRTHMNTHCTGLL